MMEYETEKQARHEGATEIDMGINWIWAKGFPSHAAAARFIAWLERNGREHRGIYVQDDSVGNNYKVGEQTKCDVRYR